jgi:hypothetical protein
MHRSPTVNRFQRHEYSNCSKHSPHTAKKWAALRGEKLPPELEAAAAAAAAAAAGPLARETWMTDLPPELLSVAGPATQEGSRGFSRTGIKPRGDTSQWTDTPQMAALRAAGQLSERLLAQAHFQSV